MDDGSKPRDPALIALGLRIKAAREHAHVTLFKVAVHFEVATSTVSRWESGENDPGTPRIAELAKLFGCDPGELAFGTSSASETAA